MGESAPSGCTPKGAMLTHDNLLSNAQTLKAEWQFSASDRLIHALPIFHTHGLFVATNVTLLAGSSMWFLPKFDADQIVDLFASSTTLMGVPTFYVRLAEHEGVTRESVARMRLFISGSAPLLAETHARFSRRTGKDILERYGMTETNMITSNPYSGRRVPGTVGHPLPGVDVRIADPSSGAPMAQGEIGVIEVKGPNVFAGYWHNPEKTKAEFRADGFFITGDLGRFDEEGYLHIVGRSKDLVITGGFNVYPKEVELELDQISGVAESAVFGVPHPDLGEGVTAAIVLDGSGEVSERQIIELLQPRLARFKQPKRVIILDALPRNAMGKVQKNLLREQYAGLYAS
jgi:malonyl-CoA/methylmalonyl-CoA synthetase